MYSEIETDNREIVEGFLLEQLKEGTNVRLTVRSEAGRYSVTASDVGDEPAVALHPVT